MAGFRVVFGACIAALWGCAGGAGADSNGSVPQLNSSTGMQSSGTAGTDATEAVIETDSGSGDTADSDPSGSATGPGDASSSGSGGSVDCPPGFADCDASGDCESDLTAATTCGSCDKTCELPIGTLVCTDGMCEGAVNFTEIEDTWVNDSNPDANFADAANLLLDNGPNVYQALLRPANLGGLPMGATIMDATMTIECYDPGSAVDVVEVVDVWDVATVTYNTKPGTGAAVDSFNASTGPHTVTITTIAQAWSDVGDASLGLQLQTSASGGSDYHSSESMSPPSFAMTVLY